MKKVIALSAVLTLGLLGAACPADSGNTSNAPKNTNAAPANTAKPADNTAKPADNTAKPAANMEKKDDKPMNKPANAK